MTIKPMESSIVLLYLLLVIGIGVVVNRRYSHDVKTFLVAGRQVGLTANSLAYFAVFISSVSFLGLAGASYSQGITWPGTMIFSILIGQVLMYIFAIKPLWRSEAYTLSEYMGIRYNSRFVRGYAGLIWGVALYLYCVTQLKGASYLIEYLTGIPQTAGIIIMGGVFLLYVTIGGAWAVTWTDVVQAIWLFVAMMIVVLTVYFSFDGAAGILEKAAAIRPAWVTVKLGWASYLGLSVTWVGATLLLSCFRVFTSNSELTARRTLVIGDVLYAIFNFSTIVIIAGAGSILFQSTIQNPDMVFVSVLTHYFGPIVVGIVVAGALAALMSSADSMFLGALSVAVHDFYAKLINPKVKEEAIPRMLFWTSIVLGILLIALTIWTPGLLLTIATSISGLMVAGLFIPLCISFVFRRAHPLAAAVSMVTGSVTYGVVFLMKVMPPVTEILVALPVSLVTFILVQILAPVTDFATTDAIYDHLTNARRKEADVKAGMVRSM